MIEELRSKGLENFIHLRSNVIEILTGFNEQIGITRGGIEKDLIDNNAHKKSVPQI